MVNLLKCLGERKRFVLTLHSSDVTVKEIQILATSWMKLEDIMLHETHKTQKDKYYVIPLPTVPKAVKFTETESRTVVTRRCRGVEWGVLFNRYQVSGWDNEKVLEMDSDDVDALKNS